MPTNVYVGSELDLFAAAFHWKAYFQRHIRPYITRNVLEVGAGLGGTTQALVTPHSWTCLEPDAMLAQRLEDAIQAGRLPASCEVVRGTLEDLPSDRLFDTVLYIDVLEHIADDSTELERAARHLRPGGYLVVLCPAHQWLFSAFDAAIGHHRRYTKATMAASAPQEMEIVRLAYLDSVGLLASMSNRLILRSEMPTRGQILFWDRVLIPLSRIVDPLVRHAIGKSVLGVWRKRAQ